MQTLCTSDNALLALIFEFLPATFVQQIVRHTNKHFHDIINTMAKYYAHVKLGAMSHTVFWHLQAQPAFEKYLQHVELQTCDTGWSNAVLSKFANTIETIYLSAHNSHFEGMYNYKMHMPKVKYLQCSILSTKLVAWMRLHMPQLQVLQIDDFGDANMFKYANPVFERVNEVRVTGHVLQPKSMLHWLQDSNVGSKISTLEMEATNGIDALLLLCYNISNLKLSFETMPQELCCDLATSLQSMKSLHSVTFLQMNDSYDQLFPALPCSVNSLTIESSNIKFPNVQHLVQLTDLNVWNCTSEHTFIELGAFSKLKTFSLQSAGEGIAFKLPASVIHFKASRVNMTASYFENVKCLESLHYCKLEMADALQQKIGNSIKTINFQTCPNMELNMIHFPHLRNFTTLLGTSMVPTNFPSLLQCLSLESCGFSEFPKAVLNIESLTSLSLFMNDIESIPASLFNNSCAAKLHSLDMRDNMRLCNVPNFSGYPSLKKVYWNTYNELYISKFQTMQEFHDHSLHSIAAKCAAFYQLMESKSKQAIHIGYIITLADTYLVLAEMNYIFSQCMFKCDKNFQVHSVSLCKWSTTNNTTTWKKYQFEF